MTVNLEFIFTGNPISYYLDPVSGLYIPDPTGRTAPQIRTSLASSSQIAISYLISADSFGLNGGQNVLRYNGSKAFKGTFNNTATASARLLMVSTAFWVYEHLLNRSGASQNVKNFWDALIASIDTQLQASAFSIPITRLNVERQADGAPVAPK